MRVIVTKHARLRMNQRMNIKRNQTRKIAEKAFYSPEKVNKKFNDEEMGFKTYLIRQYKGNTFVFNDRNGDDNFLLLTVY